MKHRRLGAAALLLLVVVAGAFFAGKSYAQTEDRISEVPKSWGPVKGTMGSDLVFEAADGTIRIAQVDYMDWQGGKQLVVGVKYQINRNPRK